MRRMQAGQRRQRGGDISERSPGGGTTSKRRDENLGTARHLRGDTGACNNGRPDASGGSGRVQRKGKSNLNSVKARALAALESDSSDSEGDAHAVGKAPPPSDAPFVTPEKSVRSNIATATANGRNAPSSLPSGQLGMIDLTGSDSEDNRGFSVRIDLSGDGADEGGETSAPIDLTGGDSDEDALDAEDPCRDAGLPQMELAGSSPSEGSRSSVQMVSNGDGTTSPSDATGDSSGEDAPGDAGAPSNIESSPLAADKETSLGTNSNRQEVGYILLEECEVLIPAGASIEAAESGVWHDVDLQPALKSGERDMDESHDLPDKCCNLVLQPCSSGGGNCDLSWRTATEISPFNGLLSEIAVKISALSTKRRSDASLLAGLAVEINDQAGHYQSSASLHLRDVRMENLQIMLWGEASRNTSTALQFDSEVEDSQKWTRMQASLLMTFSLPLREGRHNHVNDKPPQPSGKWKVLSSAHQLLGSTIRCDWSHLYTTMKRLERRAKTVGSGNEVNPSQQQQQKKKSFFPDLLSVEELYDRISGAGKHLGNDERVEELSANPSRESRNNQAVSFQDVPEEVLVTSIAPYLQARSLHALRVTSHKLFRSLSGVVPGLKKLKLFRHQVRSLEWMEMRERKAVAEVDMLGQHKNGLPFGECSFLHEGEAVCGGDYHRAVTGGATVLLAPRPSSEHAVAKETLRFDSESGVLSLISSDIEVHRKTRCARGGLLCDDPGLGKTITVLSLILRSFGLSSEPSETGAQAAGDDELFYSYWYSSFLTEHVRKPAILKLITRLRNSDAEARWFVPPIDKFLDDCPDYLEVISNPMSLQDVRKKYSKSDCRDFRAFEADVRLCFSNAMTYNPSGHDVYRAAERMVGNFDELLATFKREQIEVAAKSVSRMAKHEASRPLVDLFEAKKRAELEKPLVASSSTLLVVPNPLLMHWEEQLLLHIDFRYLSSGRSDSSPMIYYHTSKRKVQITDSRISTDLGRVSNPVILIDDGSKDLPSPKLLARFPIVLTSYNRFTSEWKSGSVESEMRASKRGGGNVYWGEGEAPEASPLLKVSWLRVIVDEGHVMGKNSTNLIQFTSWLAAQRHWAMTGTPTQQIAAQNGLKQLFYLANFCKHEYFNQRLGREKVWNRFIRDGWRVGSLASFFRLKHILSYLMVRHTKADLVEIPPPVFREVPIALSQREITTYNTIVTSIRTNIITTSMEGRTSGWQDSLLNPRQSKHATLALTNLRTSCCGGLQILPIILGRHWNETLQMLREVHKLEDVQVKVVNDFIYRATSAELSSCHQCGIQLQSLFVIPCGHLVCSECIDSKTTCCPVCSEDFDVDAFQRLQPGLDFQFNLALLEEKEAREKKQALRRVLADSTGPGGAIDLDELGGLEADGNGASERQARRHKKGEACVYSSRLQDGKCTVCREEHFDCNFMNSDKQCSVCSKFAEECPAYATKQKCVINKLLQLRNNDFADEGSKSCNVSPLAARVFARPGNKRSMHRPLKAIVFSQFRQTYEYFGDRLIRRFGGACVADYSYAKTRTEELQKFIHHPECFVMLLSKQGSVGLDLSFCTHIFFLDTIYDKSLAAQVIARAYRMGATGPVFVEQLTAKNSVEEVMSKMNAGHQVTSDSPTGNKEKLAKLHKLLVSAKLIKTHEQGSKQAKKRKPDDGGGFDKEQPNNKKRAKKGGGVRFLEGV